MEEYFREQKWATQYALNWLVTWTWHVKRLFLKADKWWKSTKVWIFILKTSLSANISSSKQKIFFLARKYIETSNNNGVKSQVTQFWKWWPPRANRNLQSTLVVLYQEHSASKIKTLESAKYSYQVTRNKKTGKISRSRQLCTCVPTKSKRWK